MTMDKDWAILQGSFLLANKLCLPSSLSSLQKCDWDKVGKPVLATVREICGEENVGGHLKSKAASWRKKLVCVVWLKLLSRENREDVEEAWRESTFFPLHSPLPEVNHTVLMELLKSLSAADIFAHFLLCLPPRQMCSELERLTEHVKSNPVGEDDVHFFLELWWQLWKGRYEQFGEQQNLEVLFANQVAHLTSQPASLTHQAAKRLKLDSSALPHNTGVLDILLHTLTDMKDVISKPEHGLYALSNCLDALYTTFLIDHSVILPIKDKIVFLSKAMSVSENSDKLSSQLIQEVQRDLRASLTPSQFQPSRLSLHEALRSVAELTHFWQSHGLLKVCSGSPSSYTAFRLQQSVHRMLAALEEADMTGEEESEKNNLRGLLASMAFPTVESSSEVSMRVAMTIVSHRLEDYHDVTVLFASEKSWAAHDERWLDCLEENKTAFQHCDTLIQLASTLTSQLHSESFAVSQARRLLKVVTAVFTALALEDKNKALAAVLRISSKGFCGCSGSSALIAGFEQELNMAFNCIIQGGGKAPTAEGNLSTAVSLVARVAFQNPEATLRSCCHSAIFNKGAFALMSKILQQLPGLEGVTESKSDGRRNPTRLLCRCLQEIISVRSLSDNEKEQFLKFVELMMVPVATVEGERESLLSPQELVNTFVLPNLALSGSNVVDLNLSLQLLHAALSVDVQQEVASSSTHWVLECSPFPLLYILAQFHDQALRCLEQPPEGAVHHWSMDTKELLASVLITLAQVVGVQVEAAPSRWSRALFWLHDKMKELDWTVYFHLKPVWGRHFKNEVPTSLLAVCHLPEQEWSGLNLPQYGPGTGLLAWMECCALSESLQSIMLSSLALDQRQSEHVSMFSKGLLVALTQTMPWCSVPQWSRLLGALKELITSGRLHVPFSLEYVEFLPLLDLRRFSYELCLSVLMLRVLQLLCGSSCSHWLTGDGWAHLARLYAHTVREVMNSLRAKLALPASGTLTVSPNVHPAPPKGSDVSCNSFKVSKMSQDSLKDLKEGAQTVEQVPSQEVLFVLSQIFCHVQHIQVMMPGGQSEPLFLSSLEILSHYQTIMSAFPESSTPLENENTKHFFYTIADNLENQEMKSVLQQKITQLALSPA
ncbi:gem-associated protein 4 [Phycodurus eques]|uniref:gem-associated protein 4 n=1 Tax=Phycodurus eques TaxID=693459 RepID=UPI002ACE35E1|nr:gem-associated protein 4 [Phycodurus eques]